VDWVTWSTGELTVDADSFLLVFKPSAAGGGGGSVKAKPLGALVRSSPVQSQEGEGRTLVVTTSDALSNLYRLTFQSTRHAGDFSKLADQAEAAHDAAVASGGLTEATSAEAAAAAAEAASRLEATIRASLASSGAPPLVFGGAELSGPDPSFPDGGEVLLGRGAVVILDPADEGHVGRYELLFYSEDEADGAAVWRSALGPKSTARRVQVEASADGPAASLQLRVREGEVHTLSFDDAPLADAFARDFRVRQRVMELASRTAKGAKAKNELLGEIEGMKRRSLGARVSQFFGLLIVVVVIAVVSRLAMLYSEDKGARPPAAYLQTLAQEAQTAVRLSRALVWNIGAKACENLVGAIPAPSLQRCLAAGEAASSDTTGYLALRHCLEKLTRGF